MLCSFISLLIFVSGCLSCSLPDMERKIVIQPQQYSIHPHPCVWNETNKDIPYLDRLKVKSLDLSSSFSVKTLFSLKSKLFYADGSVENATCFKIDENMHIGSVQDKNIIVEIKCNNVDIPCQLMYDIDYSCVPNVVDDWVFVGYSPCNTTSCDSVGWQSAMYRCPSSSCIGKAPHQLRECNLCNPVCNCTCNIDGENVFVGSVDVTSESQCSSTCFSTFGSNCFSAEDKGNGTVIIPTHHKLGHVDMFMISMYFCMFLFIVALISIAYYSYYKNNKERDLEYSELYDDHVLDEGATEFVY